MRHKIGYWNNYDNCYNEAKKYDCRNDFHNMCRKAYNSARNNGWINDYTWFKKHLHADDNYEIYAYEDRTNKIVYVGLTYRLFGNGGNNRHNEHKSKNDPVGNYFNGVIPTPRRLMSELTPEDAQYYEDWYRRKYEENGWKTLNTAKTGVGSSSLGGVNIVWNYDTCLEEAKKYEKAARFKDGNPSAYRVAANNGWIKEWFPDMKMPNGYWNYEHCKEEVSKYQNRKELNEANKSVYNVCVKNKWLDEFFPIAG